MLNRFFLIIIFFGIFISCLNGAKKKDDITVYYNYTKDDELEWKLNDYEYTYSINFIYNEKTKEKQIPEYYTLTDSIVSGDNISSLERKTYQIKNSFKPYNLIQDKNEVKLNNLIVSAEYQYYRTSKNSFTMPYELEIDHNNKVKVNIEINQFDNYSETEYGGSYQFKLEKKDIELYKSLQNKLSKNIFVTDTTKNSYYGHIIVLNKKYVNSNYETIYNDFEYSSLLMFANYIVLKYIPNLKPSKSVLKIDSYRKPISPEAIDYLK
ncbi:MAG: hypothetical protein ACRC8Z_10095 [Empedobacter falsenii]